MSWQSSTRQVTSASLKRAPKGIPDLMVRALGGAWAAGRMLRAVAVMSDAHPRGRVVAASHGDVIPVVLATLSSAFDITRPRHAGRGGEYTLQFAAGDLAITSHDPVPA
jgi:broad specificity phosphatase PhoE